MLVGLLEDEIRHSTWKRWWEALVIAFSGEYWYYASSNGVWYSIAAADVYAHSCDCINTMVEIPNSRFVDRHLKAIEKASAEQGLLIVVDQTTPQLNSFWVNRSGRVTCSNMFRWCTER